jgi:hypothetical protein
MSDGATSALLLAARITFTLSSAVIGFCPVVGSFPINN